MNQMLHRAHGFTLVELVIVIVLSGILAGVVMRFITMPIDAYVDTSRRAGLVDIAQNATGQITRALQRALPNSIRTGCGGSCIEFLRVAAGGRYRAMPPGDALYFLETDLDSGLAETGFDIVGPFDAIGLDDDPDDAAACVEARADCLVIYNTGLAAGDAWNRDHVGGSWRPDNMATLTAVSSNAVAFNNTYFSTGVDAFPASSPGQRFFIVDTPVTFLCANDALRRYDDYAITHRLEAPTAAQLSALSAPPTPVLMADRISACQFDYQPGTPTRNGLLTVRITVSESGESLTLLEQIHVANLP
jgi:MSHA biogenesis protein MshO